jgi:hypothetical protein
MSIKTAALHNENTLVARYFLFHEFDVVVNCSV